jgi:hypothetical protein
MKKYSIFLLFVFGSIFAQRPHSNEILFTLGTKYEKAEITFLDGHKESGFIYGFISNKWIEFGNPLTSGLETLENKLNLMDNSFTFKNTIEGAPRNLTQKDFNEIRIFDDKLQGQDYKLMDLKTVNVKGDIIDLHKKAWLPLYSVDKISIYAYDVMFSDNRGSPSKYAFTAVYLNNPKDNFAINPIDYNRINLFNFGKIDDKLIFVLKEVFKDCPEFVKKFNGDPKKVLSNYFKDPQQRKIDKKEFKENSKDLSKHEKKELEMKMNEKMWIDPYLKLIEEYNTTCPK